MKIELEINKKYKEPEIHICNNKKDDVTIRLKETVLEAVDGSVIAYDGDNSIVVRYSDIVRIFSLNKGVYVSTDTGEYRIKDRLYEMEEKLDGMKFVRISNSEIINIRKLFKLDTSLTGTIKMYLKNGEETYVSRRYVSKIKKALGI
ncbi:MAG: LytTR family transcriptional regulator [Clostridium sp.]|nr:LytTR family transcriptional regulator [Clostridium sp.]MCM1399676.1 LytTR family transcriptional regulator [Clostridium sp.]MCM1460536.1 LytTR family transcriptional regulator [Bacteroides sp.]